MTRIETPILRDEDDLREQTEEEVEDTLRLALKEAKDRLTPIRIAQILMEEHDINKVKTQLSNLRKGKYE